MKKNCWQGKNEKETEWKMRWEKLHVCGIMEGMERECMREREHTFPSFCCMVGVKDKQQKPLCILPQHEQNQSYVWDLCECMCGVCWEQSEGEVSGVWFCRSKLWGRQRVLCKANIIERKTWMTNITTPVQIQPAANGFHRFFSWKHKEGRRRKIRRPHATQCNSWTAQKRPHLQPLRLPNAWCACCRVPKGGKDKEAQKEDWRNDMKKTL